MHRASFSFRTGIACLAFAACFSTGHAQQAVPIQTAEANHREGIGVRGYDLVAYFTQAKAVPGQADITARHAGLTYRFSSTANRDAFVAAPEKYLPQFGGFCAYGAASGYKADADPQAFTVREGKLYLNYNSKVKNTWEADMAGLIARAEARWPETAKADKMFK